LLEIQKIKKKRRKTNVKSDKSWTRL
jgi:hypothetical protein